MIKWQKKIARDTKRINIRCSRVVFRNTSLAKFTASGIADRISIKEEQLGYRDDGGREKFKAVSSVIWRRLIAGACDAEERRGATEGERENAKETGGIRKRGYVRYLIHESPLGAAARAISCFSVGRSERGRWRRGWRRREYALRRDQRRKERGRKNGKEMKEKWERKGERSLISISGMHHTETHRTIYVGVCCCTSKQIEM